MAEPFHLFHGETPPANLPARFTCPFHYIPHPLSIRAANEVRQYLAARSDWTEELDKGKMFGVLIAERNGQIGFLAAYSGLLYGRNDHEYFVPPVYDLLQPHGHFKEEEELISALNRRIEALTNSTQRQEWQQQLNRLEQTAGEELAKARTIMKSAKERRDACRRDGRTDMTEEQLIRESQHLKAEYKRTEKRWAAETEKVKALLDGMENEIRQLKTERKQRSEQLQEWLFSQFRMRNALGEEKDLWQIFKEQRHRTPPSGAGECAAPKLLQYAYLNGLHPLAMAEFWWGASPTAEVRRHGCFYPACKSKCEPILNFMLQGLDVEPNRQEENKHRHQEPEIVYEDEWITAVDKPAGMLSVPGKGQAPSVWEWARNRYPHADGPLLVHRLDMDTSGILLIAKTKETHRLMQQLFESRNVRKKYIALLDGNIAPDEGFVRLPLCADIDDRPRQMVSYERGKPAVTRYKVLSREGGQTRVALYPLTGRTHQLRVHAAHPDGLNAPIAGDNLYGHPEKRLYLHAESLDFKHVHTGQRLHITCPAPF